MSRGLPEPFGKYKFSFSVQAQELLEPPPSAGADLEGGQLVASGSFRVDVARMLERLKDRQFSDSRDWLLPILRCAAASEATAVELGCGLRGLDLRFDGRPFTARELNDPFLSLFEGDGPEALRGRQFAFGLLALARLGVGAVQATSGGPTGQASLVIAAPGFEAPKIGINRGEGTLLLVRWSGWRSWWAGRESVARLRSAYGLSPTSLKIGRKTAARSPVSAEEGWHAFDSAGWSGAFRFLEEDGPSRIRLYWLGTLIEELEYELPKLPAVEAVLAGDSLSLDLSQARVVRDSRLDAGLDVLASYVARRHGPVAKQAWYDV